MAIVETRQDQDEALERIAPPHLRGERGCKVRTQWALDEFLRLRGVEVTGEVRIPSRTDSTPAATN